MIGFGKHAAVILALRLMTLEEQINIGFFRELENLGLLEPVEFCHHQELFDILRYGSDRGWRIEDPESDLHGLILWRGDSEESDEWSYVGPENLREQAHQWLWASAIRGDD